MCGIYGILGMPELDVDASIGNLMSSALHHRGPDDRGAYSDANIVMGMQRLAIIDVAGGQQPIFNEDRSVVVVCNGEIYNFRALREDLIARGHTFSTRSDTEVIVHLYEEFGADCVTHLSGMFALAIWDIDRRRLVVARDRLGIKPLYISFDDKRLIFASELKSLLEYPGVARSINPLALREYLALGYVPAPMTMLDGIEKLAPGTILIADRDSLKFERYWTLTRDDGETADDAEWVTEIRDTIEQSVVSQMVSDVPLGAFLSGGVDSSAVVAFMARHSERPVKTYSIGFDTDTGGDYYNELPYARRVAEAFGTDHREIVVRPDVASLLPELLWHLDEPIADAAFITTYLVSKFARQDVTVILSGVGGDELFGGYRRYWSEHLAQRYRKVPKILRKAIMRPIVDLLPSDRHTPISDLFRLAKGFMAGAELDPDERYETYVRVFEAHDVAKILNLADGGRSVAMEKAFDTASGDDPLQRLIEVDLQTQLPDDLLMLTDRMSMATSLECRVPLLDDALVDLSLRMPARLKVHRTHLKVGMKEALRGLLPDSIIDRKKRGFGAPIGAWFKHELSSFLDAVLSEQNVLNRGIFDWPHLQLMMSLHRQNKEDYTDHLLAMMNLELWCQIYLDGSSHAEVAERLAAAA